MNRIAVLAALAVTVVVRTLAQDVNASITGIVTDPSGAVVTRATVTATNTGTGARFTALTDHSGQYWLRNLPVGVYDLTATAPGFRQHEAKALRLQVNEVLRLDIGLKVGAAAETVTVTAEAITVDTTTATLKAVVDQKRIEELPLNGRNPTQLMRLVVGTVTDLRADVTSGTTYPGVTPVSVNGSRANATNYVLDGAQNNDHYNNAPNPMPNPDALQEFSVQTNNFSAEFGRNAGGVVNAVTKSGTNEVHGSAFEFVRNKAINAKPFFSPVENGRKRDDGLKRNQFGATLGGPVWLPRIYTGRNRTFFFTSYQGTLERRTPNTVQIVVPTAAQRRGDFSALSRPLRNPFAGGFYPNNLIPASDLSPISRKILEYVPAPAAGNTISTSAPTNFNDHQWLAKIDHNLSDRNRLSGRFWNSAAETPAILNPRNYLEQVTGRTWLNRSLAITDSHTFSPTLTNQALFSFNRTDGNNRPIYPASSLAALGSRYYNDDKPQWHITVAGYFQINTGDTNRFLRDEYQLLDTVRWTKGRHNLTLGGEYGRGIGDVVNNFRANGQWNFNGAGPFTGDSLADFLIGKFNSLTQGIGEYKKTRFHRLSLFAQDSFRMARRFTLDFGVRWEPFLPFTDVDGKLAVWRPGRRSTRYVNAPPGVLYPGDPGIPPGGVSTTWRNFGPRFGFAWDVLGDGRTAVRGGYGIFFDQNNTIMTNSAANQAPFGTVVTIFGNELNSFADPWAGTLNPFPASTTPPRDVTFPLYSSQFLYAPDWRNAYLQAWNLTLEREVAFGFVARASYAGSKGTRLAVGRELNPAVYAPGATTGTTNQRRPLGPALGSTTIVEPSGNSIYHALQLTAERRFANGFSILTNYQFSKAIDDSSNAKLTGQSRTNPFDQRFDRGPADFDRKHVFNFSGLWEIPGPRTRGGLHWVLGGWSLNAIIGAWSGFPFTVGSGVDNARTGTGGQRADLVGDPYFSQDRPRGEKIEQWLRRAAFAPNALGTFGNLGRNVFRGPGYATVDLGLFKSFHLSEALRATVRFEAFNALNRVNLQGPNPTQNSANFMRTTAAYDNRILQLALRLAW
jgi:hypothetical protein